jgi:hypothetical protein
MQCKGIDLEKMTSSGRMELERGELLELLEAQWIYNSLEPRGWLRLIPSRTARMVEQGYIKYQGRLGQKKIDALTKQHPEVYKRWLERDIDSGFDDLLRGEMAREGSTRDDTEEAIVKRRWLASPAPAAAEQRQELWLSWGGGGGRRTSAVRGPGADRADEGGRGEAGRHVQGRITPTTVRGKDTVGCGSAGGTSSGRR